LPRTTGWAETILGVHDWLTFAAFVLLVIAHCFVATSTDLKLFERGTVGERKRYSLQTRSVIMSNPKTEPTDNAQKDPDEWLSGDDPMTGAQASYLKTLCEQAGTPEAFNDNLTKAEASKLIDEMRQQAGVG
jgi:hypothetical protein